MKLNQYAICTAALTVLAILTEDTTPLFQKFWFLALVAGLFGFGDYMLKNLAKRPPIQFNRDRQM